MSDSDDAAFASADEGEAAPSPTKPAKAKGKKELQQKEKPKSLESPPGDAAKASAEAGKKGRDRAQSQQQQKGRKKGRGGGQTSPREPAVAKPGGKETAKAGKSKPEAAESKMSETSPVKEELPKPSKSEAEVAMDAKELVESQRSTKDQTTPASSPNKDSARVPSSASTPSAKAGSGGNEEKGTGRGSNLSSPENQSIPAEQRDHHSAQEEEVLHKLQDSAKSSGGGGGGWAWGGWGSSLLTAATTSVQTFTHQVGDGFTTIMDTVESSLGAPPPEDLANADHVAEPPPEVAKEEKQATPSLPPVTKEPEAGKGQLDSRQTGDTQDTKQDKEPTQSDSWFGSWGVADLAKKVQDTGKSLATKGQTLMTEGFDAVENLAAGGIDVLETIGKKTYNTISEHDPAFRKTRDFLSAKGGKPNLSSVLKEAKEQAEQKAEEEKENEEARKAHFGTLFDDYQGIAHLEALEMLSAQSEKKVHSLLNSLPREDLATVKPDLIAIKEALELGEDDTAMTPEGEQDFTSLVGQCVSELRLGTAPDKLQTVHSMVRQWIQDFDTHHSHGEQNVKSVHQRGIQALAELTSKGVEQFHKAGELVLMEQDRDKDCKERAHSLARLTGVLCHEVANMSAKFANCLNTIGEQESEDVTATVTNIYLEASNSSTYIQDAFQLLLPVLQQAALEHFILTRKDIQS